jgi:hypothetical protein
LFSKNEPGLRDEFLDLFIDQEPKQTPFIRFFKLEASDLLFPELSVEARYNLSFQLSKRNY